MMRTIPLTIVAVLALAACSKQDASEPQPSDTPTEEVTAVQLEPSEAASEAAPTPPASEAVAATAIPKALHGRWGLVPADCTSTLGDAKGLLTVSGEQLKFYESVAQLGKVKEAGDSRVRATFRYSGEGQTWTQDVVLDVQDGGRTMIRRDYGPDAMPGPLKYTRCA